MLPAVRDRIFDMLISLSDLVVKETTILCEVIDFISDAETIARRVSVVESEADNLMHSLVVHYRDNDLRNDDEAMVYFEIARSLETITDAIENLGNTLVAYNVTELREDIIAFLSNINGASKYLIEVLNDIRYNTSKWNLQKHIIEINELCDEGERYYSASMRRLFESEKDAIEIIKWKEIYTLTNESLHEFEHFADRCEVFMFKS